MANPAVSVVLLPPPSTRVPLPVIMPPSMSPLPIDLTNVLSTSISGLHYASGALTVTTTNGTDVLHFTGSYSTSNFTPLTDSSGNGTDIVFHA